MSIRAKADGPRKLFIFQCAECFLFQIVGYQGEAAIGFFSFMLMMGLNNLNSTFGIKVRPPWVAPRTVFWLKRGLLIKFYETRLIEGQADGESPYGWILDSFFVNAWHESKIKIQRIYETKVGSQVTHFLCKIWSIILLFIKTLFQC